MAYNSAHTGPEIDAAVQLLGQIQDARDSTSQDLLEVKDLAAQVKIDAGQVSAQTETVTAKASQVSSSAVAVEQARSEVEGATEIAQEAKDAAVASAASALESQGAASVSEQAAAQSQLAAGLSEQVSAESAAEAATAAEQVAADRVAAAASAASAAASAQNAEAVVTGGTASVTPGSGLIPLADAQGKIASDWLPIDIARMEAVQAAVDAAAEAVDAAAEARSRAASFLLPSPEVPFVRDDGSPLQVGDRYFNSIEQAEFIFTTSGWQANDSLFAIEEYRAELANESGGGGAEGIGFDDGTVADILAFAKPFADYAEIRTYSGIATAGRILSRNLAGDFRVDPSSSAADNGVTIIVDAIGRRWVRQFSGPIDVRWAGAIGGTTTDDNYQAIQKCCDIAAAAGGGAVMLPEMFRKADTSVSIKPGNNVMLFGLGEGTGIFHDDRPDNPVRQDVIDLSLTIGVTLKDFRVVGTVKTYPTETNQKNAIVGTNVRNVRIENVTLDSLRFMAINLHYVRGGVVTDCTLRDIMRDGVRMTHSQDIKITDNDFERVADDAIALHMLDASTAPVGSGAVVTGNTFEFCQGAKILGAKVLTVADNVWRRSIRLPLVISNNYDLEGNTAVFAINIHDNHFIDTFNNYRTTLSDCVMSITFRNRTNGALTTRPGVSSSVFPYNYLNDNDAAGAVNIGAYGVNIHDNKIYRTIDATGQLLSTLGYGNVLDRKGGSADEGYFDPILTSTFFDTHGIRVFGAMRGLNIHDNEFSGGGLNKSAIIIDGNDSNGVHEDQMVHDNTFTDWPGIGVDLRRTTFAARYVSVRGNKFNLDPLMRHPDHNADNTWSSIASVVAIACGATGLHGFAESNEFEHCAAIVDQPTRMSWGRSNVVKWQPPGTGTGLDDNAANKGVRYIPSAIRLVHVIYNGDPTSASFKSITTTPRMAANAMPTTGTYVYGHITENTTPTILGTVGSRYIIMGWARLNTGSAHVANTDWTEMRALTGT